MPIINHRFLAELLDLEQNPLVGKRHLLIVGTFNPAHIEGKNNYAKWFYGRCENRLWYLLPKMMGHASLHIYENHDDSLNELAEKWRSYCAEHRIVIVDIYKQVEAALENFRDDDIENPVDHLAFDFEGAFAETNFDAVIFTRKTFKAGTMRDLFTDIENYFVDRDVPVLKLHSPSPRGRATEAEKLAYWTDQYKNILGH